MSGIGIAIVVLSGVALAGAVCWVVIGLALRRSRNRASGAHGR
jgi:hypothetical protein